MKSTNDTVAQVTDSKSRGRIWFDKLTQGIPTSKSANASVLLGNGELAARACRFILVQPDKHNHYPRARSGEVGLLEGWAIAQGVQEIINLDAELQVKRPIISIVDAPSQAYGRREEALGIHLALAGAVSAYARARQKGHPVLALLVGKAMSGAFLAHGFQANRIFALDDTQVLVHAMGKSAAARITLRSEAELDRLAQDIPPMAYDLKSFSSLGLVEPLLAVTSADAPQEQDIHLVQQQMSRALDELKGQNTGFECRLNGRNREATRKVRQLIDEQWATAQPRNA